MTFQVVKSFVFCLRYVNHSDFKFIARTVINIYVAVSSASKMSIDTLGNMNSLPYIAFAIIYIAENITSHKVKFIQCSPILITDCKKLIWRNSFMPVCQIKSFCAQLLTCALMIYGYDANQSRGDSNYHQKYNVNDE